MRPASTFSTIQLSNSREAPEHSCGVISVGELTNLMFGYPSKEDGHLKKELKENLKKFIPLSKVFLNEVV